MLGEELADALRFSVFALCGTGLLFYTSPHLTLLTLLAVPPIVIATSMLGRRVKALAAQMQQAQADAGAAASEIVSGIRTVRAFSQEAAEGARYDRQVARALEFARRKIVAAAELGGVSFIAGECAALLAIWVGGSLIVTGRLTTGALISFILYALLVARGFRNASRFSAESLRAAGATQWIFELLGRPAHIPLAEGGERPGDLDGSIVFEAIRFRYPTRPDVEALKGIDLRIEPGEIVAVVGRSGAGKSTLLNLILRFYDPNEGRVLIGGRDVRELDPRWFRRDIATVLQEPTLFSRSVAENISYGLRGADDHQIAAAAGLACADEFIHRLPGGYDDADRRSRRAAVGRAAPAARHRPRGAAAPEDSRAGRSDERARRGARVDRAGSAACAGLSADDAHHRAPPVDGRPRRPGHRPRRGPGRREPARHDELIHTSTFYRQLVQTQLVAQ